MDPRKTSSSFGATSPYSATMTSLNIRLDEIPSLQGKTAIITGAASGIGLAAALIMARKGAAVYILDLKPRHASELPDILPPDLTSIQYRQCDITSWPQLRAAFELAGRVDIAIANAGFSDEQHQSYFDDIFDDDGNLLQPTWNALEVNFRAVLDFVKLAWSYVRKHSIEGSIVITASTSSYLAEQALPVYSSAKTGLIGLVRSLRSVIINDKITINAVAPSGTVTPSMVPEFLSSMLAKGVPISAPEVVGLALVYSAVAHQSRMVETYGKDKMGDLWCEGRWNGRCILTQGETFTEIEEPLADLKQFWFGHENLRGARAQQAAIDSR